MIDFYSSYFTDLTLLEQLELINYLNDNFKPKCHRIDVAIDDYSRELFPILQMLVAYEMGNYFGFKETNEQYLYCRSEGCIGTLPLGSRHSEHYVRIYTLHKYFDRWETELKRKKAQRLFDELARLINDKSSSILPIKSICKTLVDTAIGQIDFRDKSKINSSTNATRARTKRLSFWQERIDKINQTIERLPDSNYL